MLPSPSSSPPWLYAAERRRSANQHGHPRPKPSRHARYQSQTILNYMNSRYEAFRVTESCHCLLIDEGKHPLSGKPPDRALHPSCRRPTIQQERALILREHSDYELEAHLERSLECRARVFKANTPSRAVQPGRGGDRSVHRSAERCLSVRSD